MQVPDEKATMFNTNFIAVSLINLIIMTGYYLLLVIIGPYSVERFEASPSLAGLTAGIMIIGCLAGRFVTGGVIERTGFKRVLFFGLAVYTGSVALYLFADSLPLLLFNRFVGGVGVGCIGTMTSTIVAHILPPRQQGLGISYFSLSTVLALAAGPFLGIALMQALTYETIFLVCLGFGAASFCIALCMKISVELSSQPLKQRDRAFRLGDYIEYRAVPLGFVVLLASLCYVTVQAFISFYARESGFMTAASFFFLVYAVCVFATRPATGRLFDRKGENIVFFPALMFFSAGLFLFSLAGSSLPLLFAGALLGLGFGNFQSLAQAATLKIVPRQRFGQATSTYFILLDLGIGLGPYVFGFLVPMVGYRGMYLAAAVVSCFCLPLYYLLHGKKSAAVKTADPNQV